MNFYRLQKLLLRPIRAGLIAALSALAVIASPQVTIAQAIIPESKLSLNIVSQAQSRIGKLVRDGSDVGFIDAVLNAAGAQTGFKDYPTVGDHVWGVYLGKMTHKGHGVLTTLEAPAYDWRPGRGLLCHPGDILQFANVHVQSATREVNYLLSNIAAVVTAVSPHGRYCRFVTQVSSSTPRAAQLGIYMPSLKAGTIRAFRPVNSRTAKITRESNLNGKLLQFCIHHLGSQVNDGQCAMLVETGLEKIGAATGFRDYPTRGDYVWGALIATISAHHGKITISVPASRASLVKNLSEVFEPGNILQLHGVHIAATTADELVGEDADHHTAVVSGFSDQDDVVHVLEQNSNGKLYVTRGTYNISGMITGTIRVYQPLPK